MKFYTFPQSNRTSVLSVPGSLLCIRMPSHEHKHYGWLSSVINGKCDNAGCQEYERAAERRERHQARNAMRIEMRAGTEADWPQKTMVRLGRRAGKYVVNSSIMLERQSGRNRWINELLNPTIWKVGSGVVNKPSPTHISCRNCPARRPAGWVRKLSGSRAVCTVS